MNSPELSEGYDRSQVFAVLSGLLLATFVASLDQTVVSSAMYRIGESLNGLTATNALLATTSAPSGTSTSGAR